MNVGLTYILRENMLHLRYVTEFDSEQDIRKLIKTIKSAGHSVVDLGFGDKLINSLSREKVDIVFNYAEGFRGSSRESQVPSLLEMLDIPIIGSSAFCLFITQNKHICSTYCQARGIPVPKCTWFDSVPVREVELHELSYPLIIKPSKEGSSYGIDQSSIVYCFDAFRKQVEYVLSEFSSPVIVEEFIQGQELCIGLIGNNPPTVFPILETCFDCQPEIITYEMKKTKEGFHRKPANVPTDLQKKLNELAIHTYRELRCTDYARIDLRIDKNNNPYVIDVNPTPSLKEQSSYPSCAYLAELSYDDLVKQIIHEARIREGI